MKIFIGTSGWVYPHWEEIFYPKELSSKGKPPHQKIGGGGKLKYYSQYFKTVEINYSFYRLPGSSTYQNWYSQTPGDFLFAVKASRFITHIKRLKGVGPAWKVFIKNALNLKGKLGPILFQFPPSFKATDENIKRLEEFLKFINKPLVSKATPKKGDRLFYESVASNSKLRCAFEFRHRTWYQKKIYRILKKYNSAWVIADSPSFPKAEKITADFVYIRMHGSKVLFSSKYSHKELKALAKKIKKWQKQNRDIFVYFNNDAQGFAIENAKTLLACIGSDTYDTP